MTRLRQVPRDEVTAKGVRFAYDLVFGDRDPVAEPGTADGTPGDWWTTFALVPEIMDYCLAGFALYRNPSRALSPQLRELGQTRTGWLRSSAFVFSQHCKSMRDVGFTDEQVTAIPSCEVADCFDAAERAVLAYTDALVGGDGRVPDGVFAALQEHLSDVEILELTYITAMYEMHAIMSRALRTEFDDVADPMDTAPGYQIGAGGLQLGRPADAD
ncbi:MAG: carboxymuconolactone decarboxylase family protein [Acidimicrobiales bacterium]